MTNEDFKAWRALVGYSLKDAGIALGKSVQTIRFYENGIDYQKRKVDIPRSIMLACAAISVNFEAMRFVDNCLMIALQNGGEISCQEIETQLKKLRN